VDEAESEDSSKDVYSLRVRLRGASSSLELHQGSVPIVTSLLSFSVSLDVRTSG